MENLLPYFEYEAGLLSLSLAEFAERYPKIAARLGIAGGTGDDLHVDRLTQTFALLAARIGSRLDDDYPEFTDALLDVIYPGYLRTVPSCAIACFRPDDLFGQLTEPLTIARGTTLDANAAPCRFRTVYDVAIAPIRIHSARYAATTLAPAAVTLPVDTTGIVSITFSAETVSQIFNATIPSEPLRLHLSGDRPLVAALADTLLLRADAAFVEADSSGIWTALSQVPIEAAGFASSERLLPEHAENNSSALQCLSEYFAFPEMFDFIDIDLERLRRAARSPNARKLTLHVAVCGTPAESAVAQTLKTLDAKAFRLFCTPVVNLFARQASPIQVTDIDTAYPVIPMPLKTGSPLEIYSIDAVHISDRAQFDQAQATSSSPGAGRTALSPYRAFSHGNQRTSSEAHWMAFRDPFYTGDTSRSPTLLSLVGMDGSPARIQSPHINVDTTATNGNLPCRLPIGAPDSDLLLGDGALSCPIMLLAQPTQPSPPPRGPGALWRVLSALSPHPMNLAGSGLKALKAFLELHGSASNRVVQRCVDAMTDLDYKPAIRWMSIGNQFPSFVRGIEISLSFDESALREVALSVLGRVLERLFSTYVPMNSYVQLVLLSAQTGRELLRCAPKSGTRPLI
jgi:type VI secretion system protein ImpG